MADSSLSTRRDFFRGTLLAAAGITLNMPALARNPRKGKMRIGMISDVHQDIMHDAMDRLRA
ncbi:MAG: hypothetical protein RI957_1631, partial [Verrucomicrobiota bacterium]